MKKSRGSLVATTNQWGESENGLALLVDLGGFSSKFNFSNVMAFTVPAPRAASEAADCGLRNSTGGFARSGYGGHYDDDRGAAGHDSGAAGDDSSANERLLDSLQGSSSTIAKQLARIEVMAEELEEDFARTGDEINRFRDAINENVGDVRNTRVAHRLKLLDGENEENEKRERAEKEERRERKKNGTLKASVTFKSAFNTRGGGREDGGGGGGGEGTAMDGTVREAEGDLKECWSLINQLTKQLY